MTRSRAGQSRQDDKVRRIANKLDREGFNVEADVKGRPKPGTIGGYRPDVIATKGSQRRIIEVETPDSVGSARDQAQQQAFKRAAARSQNTTFRRTIAE